MLQFFLSIIICSFCFRRTAVFFFCLFFFFCCCFFCLFVFFFVFFFFLSFQVIKSVPGAMRGLYSVIVSTSWLYSVLSFLYIYVHSDRDLSMLFSLVFLSSKYFYESNLYTSITLGFLWKYRAQQTIETSRLGNVKSFHEIQWIIWMKLPRKWHNHEE